jgi:subtilase family serine protease
MAFFGRSVARRHDVDGVYDLRMNGTNATDKTYAGNTYWSHTSQLSYSGLATATQDLGENVALTFDGSWTRAEKWSP